MEWALVEPEPIDGHGSSVYPELLKRQHSIVLGQVCQHDLAAPPCGRALGPEHVVLHITRLAAQPWGVALGLGLTTEPWRDHGPAIGVRGRALALVDREHGPVQRDADRRRSLIQ